MKSLNLCTIGNALVDIDIEVSNDTLERLNVEKGVMTLIDSEREHLLLEELDGIKHLKACGGSAANTTVLFSQLGGSAFYCCKIANDQAGDFYYQDLQDCGVQTNFADRKREAGVTGKCIAMITPDADRTMNTYLGITQDFSTQDLNEQAIASAEYLYIEGYLVAADNAYQACLAAKKIAEENNTKIALTFSDPNMTHFFRQQLATIINDRVDLLFCNKQEALIYCQCDTIEQAKVALTRCAKQFVITLGEEGAVLYDGENFHYTAAYQSKAIDTIGAGDVFAGAFLYALTYGCDFATAGDIAALAAAKIVTKFGARLDAAEVANIKAHLHKHEMNQGDLETVEIA